MKVQTVFTIPGVPSNWANERLSRMEMASAMKDWKWLANRLAHGARVVAGWPLPIKTDPPVRRWVEFTQYRYTLVDDDGAWNSMKPIIDGLKGALIWDDASAWCQVIARPAQPLGQVHISASEKARVIIRVRLTGPVSGEGAASGQRSCEPQNSSAALAPSPASERGT